ncbi:MAG: MATE family efflux transporter [Polyangiales bacterium]
MNEDLDVLTRTDVLRRAWPIIIANATVPLIGLVDTAVIGHAGRVFDLGAIALGTLVFNLLYFGVGFLRMGTTGFIAQAVGAGDELEVRAVLGRALIIALVIGLGLVLLKLPIAALALQLLHGSDAVERVAGEYVSIRLWAAPAVLSTLAIRGALIGLGRSRDLLVLETALNALNLGLNVTFVAVLGWGARGVALGTMSAEWVGFCGGLWLVWQRLRERSADAAVLVPWGRIWHPDQLRAMLGANGDILLRTVFLLFGFAFFTDRSAQLGDSTLAANHVLLQFISFSAFFLDGYANVAESLVGAALGGRRRGLFDRAVQRSSELALVSALVLSLLFWSGGGLFIGWLTDLASVQQDARAYLPFAALYVLLSVAAFQLDGIFIGATRTRAMRNASLISASTFLLAAYGLAPVYGNAGLWVAFIVFVVARAVALGAYFPALRRSVGDGA